MEKQDSMVKISVVTVCFNSAKTIEQTIQSVINQSYKNVEFIIIDGGSTDGTLDIIKKYESYISYWISEPDKGTYDAMNKGIRQATGELVAFLNSDDWYSEDALRRVALTYDMSNADVLYGDLHIVDMYGNSIELINRANNDISMVLYTTVVDHPCSFVKTSILKHRPFNIKYRIAADYDLFNDLYLKKYKFVYVDNGYIANFRTGGCSTTEHIECRKEAYSISKKYLKHYTNEEWYLTVKHRLRKNRLFIFLMEIQEKLGDNYRQKIKKMLSGRNIDKVYIFGAGDVGRMIGKVFYAIGVDFSFADNNINIQGNTMLDRTVLSPNVMVPSDGNMVLVANMGDTSDMLKQLYKIGFKKDINCFDFHDWCMYLAYLKYHKI